MTYHHVKTAKIAVNDLKYQVYEPSSPAVVKDERISSSGASISTSLHSGAAMIETILSVIILLVMSMVFKLINVKQHEFDRLEDKRR